LVGLFEYSIGNPNSDLQKQESSTTAEENGSSAQSTAESYKKKKKDLEEGRTDNIKSKSAFVLYLSKEDL